MELKPRITMTPYGKGRLVGYHVDSDNNRIGYIVLIRQADYLRNYPGIPACDGTHINIAVSEDQLDEMP